MLGEAGPPVDEVCCWSQHLLWLFFFFLIIFSGDVVDGVILVCFESDSEAGGWPHVSGGVRRS